MRAIDKHERHDLDFYPTDGENTGLTLSLLKHCPAILDAISILEPCAGKKDIRAVIKSVTGGKMPVDTNDINPEYKCGFNRDATLPLSWLAFSPVCWVITNPPFKKAWEIIPLAYEHATRGIAFLIPLTHLEPCKDRSPFLKEHPPDRLIIFNPRPKWRNDTDNTDLRTVAWFVWHKPYLPVRYDTPFVFDTEWKSHRIEDFK